MRIAMVGDIDPRDELHDRPSRLAALAGALCRRGQDVTIYTRDGGQHGDPLRTVPGCRVVRVPAGPLAVLREDETLPHLGRFANHLVGDWRRNPPAIVHAHSWQYGLAAQLAADQCGVPTVQTFRPQGLAATGPGGRADPERAKIESLLVRKASWVAADCAHTMLAHLRLGALRGRMSVLCRGVDVAAFTRPEPRDLRDNRRVVVVAPDLSEHHGAEVALRALRGVPTAELLVVGDGDTDELRRLAAELGVGYRVDFAPMVSYADLPGLLHAAGIVACLPRTEPADSVVLEAMAAGIPVIASAVGELLDIVVHEITGLLIKPASPVDLARALRIMHEDSFRRHGMGFAGRTRVRSRYSWDRIAADALDIYGKVHAVTGSSTVIGDGGPHRLPAQ